MSALRKEQPVETVKKSQTFIQQAFNFWMLSSLIRRGEKNPVTHKRTLLPSERMMILINHYLETFHWTDKVLGKISELQTIAYRKMREENAVKLEANS